MAQDVLCVMSMQIFDLGGRASRQEAFPQKVALANNVGITITSTEDFFGNLFVAGNLSLENGWLMNSMADKLWRNQ